MRVVFMGTPDFSVGTLRELAKAGHEIAGVISQPDKPKGRGKNLQPTPVKEVAIRENIPVLQPRKVRDPEVVEELRTFDADVIVVVAFGQLIPKSIQRGQESFSAFYLPLYCGSGVLRDDQLPDCGSYTGQ